VVVAVVGLLVLGGMVDRKTAAQTRAAGPEVRPMPTAAPARAISSAWFCGGALGQPAKVADGQLVIANSLDRALHGTVTFVTSDTGSGLGPASGSGGTVAAGGSTRSAGSTLPVTVGPLDRLIVPEMAAGNATFIGATVELDGGGAAVQQVVTGTEGIASTACASTGSNQWYFADGTTEEHSNLYLTLVDPYSEDAIVDLSFTTEQGPEAPADFQGIVVSAGSVVGIDVGTHLRQRARVATTVSARAGRIVAFKTQVVAPATAGSSGTSGASGTSAASGASGATGAAVITDTAPPRPRGLSLVLGSPSPGTTWWWPQGVAGAGTTERYRIYNPGTTAAAVTLSAALDTGSADPFQLQVAPQSVVTVVSNNESRIPLGVGHAVILRSTNGVGVVAERTLDAVAPSPALGLSDTLGSRLTAVSWLVPGSPTDTTFNGSVIIENPGVHAATVSLLGLQNGASVALGPSSLAVPAGGRLVVPLDNRSPSHNEALLVRANTPVVVERDQSQVKGMGLDATVGVPISSP
jgi:hypothetical protein